MVKLQCCCEGGSRTAPWHVNVMLTVSQKTTTQPVGLFFVCYRPAFVSLLKHTHKQRNKQIKTPLCKEFPLRGETHISANQDSNTPSQPFSKPAEFVTGLGEVLHRNDIPKWISGLGYLLASCGSGRQRPGQVSCEWNWISE